MPVDIAEAGMLTRAQERKFWRQFTAELAHDDGQAAREHLAAGHPIYLCEADTPEGLGIKQYPDGRRELVYFDELGEQNPTGREVPIRRPSVG